MSSGINKTRWALRRFSYQRRVGQLCVEINNPQNGFFAHLEWLLEILLYSKLTGVSATVRLSSPQYVKPDMGSDFLAYFFQYRALAPEACERDFIKIVQISELGWLVNYDKKLTFDLAHSLLFSQYALRADFEAEVDLLRESMFHESPTLGVHYRGTDKHVEADRISYDRIWRAIDEQLKRSPGVAKLFVATDESAFLDQTIARHGKMVCFLPDHRRSKDGQPIHLFATKSNGYLTARDAMLNCLLLSQCSTVLKTSSILSSWAKVFNPSLEIYTLSRRIRRHSYFPERDIPDFVFDNEKAVVS